MTDRSKLLALAEAVEKLTGPDRAIDGMIAQAIGANPCWATVQKDRRPELFTDGKVGLRAREWLAPKYTASLDAAMTLVPEGWRLELEQHSSSWTAQLANAPWFDDRRQIADADGPTAIIALCAAALRAQAEALA